MKEPELSDEIRLSCELLQQQEEEQQRRMFLLLGIIFLLFCLLGAETCFFLDSPVAGWLFLAASGFAGLWLLIQAVRMIGGEGNGFVS